MSNPDLNVFAKYIPGFEFLHNLTRQAAGSAVAGGQATVPGMPPMSHWVAPTFDVEELEKRIQDLKAVHFWLDQNTKALGATIQALEVQKMTLATLKGMNMSLGEIAEAFKIRPETMSAAAPAAQPEPAPAPETATPADEAETDTEAAQAPAVDPMQWWNSLTEQFQTIAAGAVRDMADHASRAAETMSQVVQASPAAESADQAATSPKKRPARKAAPSQAAKSAAKTTKASPAKPAAKAKAKTAPATKARPPATRRSQG